MSLRTRILVELGVLAVLTVGFLLVFPDRPMGVDVALALFALALIAANARFTKNVVWSRFPPRGGRADPRRSFAVVCGVTAAAILVLLVGGLSAAHATGGRQAIAQRFLNPGLLVATGLYLPWALLQQTLFQFYLLGRLRVVFAPGRLMPIVIAGVAYSLVHLPDPGVTVTTALAGVFWSWAYDRYRVLSSLALSHALVGATFYYWIYGKDLAALWLRVPGL